MHHRRVHGQPLRQGVFAGNHHVDVMPAAQAVIEDRQQAIGIGRQVNAHDIGLLVDHVIEEAGVLVGEAVVILLPDVGGEQIVQRGDLPAPRQFRRYLQPLGVLAEHGVDDANEGLIAVEQPVPAGQQITFQPTLALVLAEHRVQHASGGREEFIILYFPGVPLTVGDFENRSQEIRECLVGTEDTEIALILVQLGHVTQEIAKHKRILAVNGAGRGHIYRVGVEVRHAKVAQQNAAVGVRIGAHPPVALRRQFGQFRHEPAFLSNSFTISPPPPPPCRRRAQIFICSSRRRGLTHGGSAQRWATCSRPCGQATRLGWGRDDGDGDAAAGAAAAGEWWACCWRTSTGDRGC